MRFGPFEVLEKPDTPGEPHMLGRGGMGTTYKARDTRISRIVALKTVRLDQLSDSPETSIKRFEAEARMLAGLNHPNIAVFLESGQQAGNWYYAMEFIQGRDLEREVKENGPLPLADALDVCMQAAQALTELDKKKLVHRDIKPGNLMAIPLEGGRRAIKLIDFGISKTFGGNNESTLTMESTSGLIPFSADTCSPEQAEGKTDLDVRSDIFSLGATLWYLVTGSYPYHAGDSSIRRIASRIYEEPPYKELARFHPALTDLMRRMMARNRQFRPASAAELVRDIQGIIAQVASNPGAVRAHTAPAREPAEAAPPPTSSTVLAPPVPARRGGGGKAFLAVMLTGFVSLAAWNAFLRETPVVPPAPLAPVTPGPKPAVTDPSTPEVASVTPAIPPVTPVPATPTESTPPTTPAETVEKMTPPVIPSVPTPPPPPTVDLAKRARAEAVLQGLRGQLKRVDALGSLPEEQEKNRAALTASLAGLETDLSADKFERILAEAAAAEALGEAIWADHVARGAARLSAWKPTLERLADTEAAALAPIAFQRAGEALTLAHERITAAHYLGMEPELASVQGAYRTAESLAIRVKEAGARVQQWLDAASAQPKESTELVADSWRTLLQGAADLRATETTVDEALTTLDSLDKRKVELLALNLDLRRKREEQAAMAMKQQAEEAALRQKQVATLADARSRLIPLFRQAIILGGETNAAVAEAQAALGVLASYNAPGSRETVDKLKALLPRLGRAPKALDDGALDLGEGIWLEMIYLPPGSYTMGSTPEDQKRLLDTVTPEQRKYWEKKLNVASYPSYLKVLLSFETRRKATLSKGFWMARHEVTQAAWARLLANNPSRMKSAGLRAPVENVSWEDTRLFLAALNRRLGRPAARLPTEAEWEYACRAGTDTDIPAGNLVILGANHCPTLDDHAWYGGNSRVDFVADAHDSSAEPEKQYPAARSGTHGVGLKKPNAWGLYDMIGGVSEWCQDWFDPTWTAPELDPAGPPKGQYRVLRGGSWGDNAVFCRSAARSATQPTSAGFSFGLRLVVDP